MYGLTHPEAGHQYTLPCKKDEGFKPVCPIHKDPTCTEGYVSNYSIARRLGCSIDDLIGLDDNIEALGLSEAEVDEAYDSVAYHVAVAIRNTTLVACPEVFVIGGGVI